MSEAAHTKNAEVAYERRDVDGPVILLVGVLFVVIAVIIHAAVWALFKSFDARSARQGRPATLVNARPTTPPVPRLQVDPAADLRRMRASEDESLESYGWIDKEKGIARIPIERAMELIAGRGLPTGAQAGVSGQAAGLKGEGGGANAGRAAGADAVGESPAGAKSEKK